MDIYYASDIHLEFNKNYRLNKPISDYPTCLILAGDLGNYKVINDIESFLEDTRSKFDAVIYVLGNHEYYYTDLVQGYVEYSDLCERKDVILLENQSYNINGVNFVGSTYWSYIHPSKEFSSGRLNDFKFISDMDQSIFNLRHTHNKKYLMTQAKQLDDTNPKIAITHHAPLIKSTADPKYTDPTGFSSNEPEVVRLYDHWVFGHTHYRNRFQFENTWLYTNALGYPRELGEFQLEHFIVS